MVEINLNRVDANQSLMRLRSTLNALSDNGDLREEDYLYMIHHLNTLDAYINSKRSDVYDD